MSYIFLGMSEGCGGVTSNLIEPGKWKSGSVGLPYPGMELKLHEQNDQGEGEVSGSIVKYEVYYLINNSLKNSSCICS